jgi:isopentenyl diphosphate isomerase/L-lactate dehydrogenase-like FMN-dependent dehydrogenase
MPGNPVLATIEDYGNRCREVLPSPLFDTIFGTYGAPRFETNTNNMDGFKRLRLRPRVLTGAGERNLATTVLGEPIAFPVMIAPVGFQQRFHPDGELAAARAAGSHATLMALSSYSNYSIEEVAAVATGPLWFQLYFFKDRELNRVLVERAAQTGYKAIVVTVDNVTSRARDEREYRFMDGQLHSIDPARVNKNFENLPGLNVPIEPHVHDSHEENLTWSDIDWLRSLSSLPLVVKGIQTAEDAALCVAHGVDGLVISNHGGHTLNRLRGTIDALPEIVRTVEGRLEVYLDGGIRSGIDVLLALALGARAVFIGRATYWGLTLGGESGVNAVLDILRKELLVATGLCGVREITAVDASLVERATGC